MDATVKYNPGVKLAALPGAWQPDLRIPGFETKVNAVRSMIAEWTKKKLQHRECLIRAALLRFLTPQEIALTAETKSKALLDYHGLVIEHINPPGALRSGMKAFIPETLRIHKDGKVALSVNLEMNQDVPKTERSEVPSPEGEGS